MAEVLEFVRPAADPAVVQRLVELVDEAARGEFTAFAIVKMRSDQRFAIEKSGRCSDLEIVGALEFVKHDLISANPLL